MVYGYCVPRSAWNVDQFDGFFFVLFHRYVSLIAAVDSCVDHAVHQWEPVFLPQYLLGLGLSYVC